MSGQPCGCDPEAHWVCEWHRTLTAHLSCPDCGNDDPSLFTVINATRFADPFYGVSYYCEVCSHQFIPDEERS